MSSYETSTDVEQQVEVADYQENTFTFQEKESFHPEWSTPLAISKQLEALKTFGDNIQSSEEGESPTDEQNEQAQAVFDQIRGKLSEISENSDELSQEELVVSLSLIQDGLLQLGLLGQVPEDISKKVAEMVDQVESSKDRQQELLVEANNATSEAQIDSAQLEEVLLDSSSVQKIEKIIDQADPQSSESSLVIENVDLEGNKSELKIVEGKMLIALLVVVLSDSLFKTNNMSVIIEEMGELGGKSIMGVLGFPSETAAKYSSEAVGNFLNELSTENLFNFLKKLKSSELTNFLMAMDPEDAALLMTAERFGDKTKRSSKQHIFTELQTDELIGELRESEIEKIISRFDARAIEAYLKYLPDDDKKKFLAGEKFGPENNLKISPNKLEMVLGQLSTSDRQRLTAA